MLPSGPVKGGVSKGGGGNNGHSGPGSCSGTPSGVNLSKCIKPDGDPCQ